MTNNKQNREGNNEEKPSILPDVNGGEVEGPRVMKLENELFDYQYNMGLLLIEKKQCAAELGEMRQLLAVTNENLKQEQIAHLRALSEMEKRDQELRKAVGVEKQCVAHLEKALHKMREESAEVKYASDRKMEEAHALVLNIEDKSSELKMKLAAADAKFAEVSQISLELERKLKQVEVHESAIRSEYHSFIAEREMHEVALSKQRKELQAWERLLQEREERQLESWRILNQRDIDGNENVETLRQKLKHLEELQTNIDDTHTLKLDKNEDDNNISVANVEIDAAKNTKAKEKEVLATADKLNAGETMEKTKKPLVKKLRRKVVSKNKRSGGGSVHDEVKSGNQEYEIEKKVMESPEQETNHLAEEKVQLTENLNPSEEERNILDRLQAELEQERDKCIVQQELLSKEREDLKQERENFEKEWEMLDMKRVEIAKELKRASEEKELLIELKRIKQETITNENMPVTHDDSREFGALGLEREPLGSRSENEPTTLAGNAESARKEKEERLKIEKEKTEVARSKKYIEEHLFEMQNYAKNLNLIVNKLKDQRNKFVTLLETSKNCERCGQVISECLLSDIQVLQELDNLHLPRLLNSKEIAQTGPPASENTSWLQKCTSKIFKFSSLKRNESNVSHCPINESHPFIMEDKKETTTVDKRGPSISSNISDMQGIQLDDGIGGASVHEIPYKSKTQEGTSDAVKQSKLKTGRAKLGPRGRKSQKMKGMKEDPSKGGFTDVNVEIQGSSNFPDKGEKIGRKRNYARASKTTIGEQDVDNNENQYDDDFVQGSRKKRLQTVVLALETPAIKRHRVRRPRNLAKAAMNRTPNFNKGKTTRKMDNGIGIGMDVGGEDSIPGIIVDHFLGFTGDTGTSTTFVNLDNMEDNSPMENSPRVELAEDNDCENSRSISTAEEYIYEDELNSEFSGEVVHENDEDCEEDDDDEEHLGMIIGRKLWTFFTT